MVLFASPHLKIKRSYRQTIKIVMLVAMFFIGLNLFSCKKINNEPSLPPATQNGSNTMGAYINNVVWVPSLSFSNPGIKADYGNAIFSILGISGNSNSHGTTSIYIELFNFNGKGNYTLISPDGTTSTNSGSVSTIIGISQLNYITDSLHQGVVTITHFDSKKGVISGTFQIKLVNQFNPSDTLSVTNGRFDVACPLNQF